MPQLSTDLRFINKEECIRENNIHATIEVVTCKKYGNAVADRKLGSEEILLREYEKCFDFVLHQDRIAWELTSTYLAVQIGPISDISILFSSGKTVTSTTPFQVFVMLGGTIRQRR